MSNTTCKDCGAATSPGAGSARCHECWDERCRAISKVCPSETTYSNVTAPTWLDEIEQRLAAATPGPWRKCDIDKFNIEYYANHTVCVLGEANQAIFSSEPVGNPTGLGNAALIAHCPTDLRRLLDEVKRLRAERTEMLIERGTLWHSEKDALEENARLVDEVKRLREEPLMCPACAEEIGRDNFARCGRMMALESVQLREDNARLRAALEPYARDCGCAAGCRRCEAARDALEGEK